MACSRPAARASAIFSPRPFSTIGVRPSLTMRTLSRLMSTPHTVCPVDARHAEETVPTYPKPTIAMFILTSLYQCSAGKIAGEIFAPIFESGFQCETPLVAEFTESFGIDGC